jgi:hypothetical protein
LIAAAQRAVTRSIDRYAMFRQADGAAGASSAPPNYPAMLAPYGRYRPPWNVAGVDYYVGVRPGSQLQDWRTLNRPDLTPNVSQGVVFVGPTCTLVQNIDFSLGTGAVLRNGAGGSSAYTVNNCKFGAPFPDAFYLQATGSLLVDINFATVTLTNCTFDGTGTGNGSPDLATFVTCYSSMVVMYNLFYHPTQSVLSLGAASAGGPNFSLVYKYNLIYNHLVRNLNHRNEVQWLGQGATITSCQVGFNTSYQDITDITATYGGGEGIQFDPGSTGVTFTSPAVFNNTLISKTVPQTPTGTTSPVSAWMHGNGVGGSTTVTGGTITNNYFDPTGAFYVFYPGTLTPAAGWTGAVSGNRDMTTNRIITPA